MMLVENKEFYGYDLYKTLQSSGVTIERSRLYRILNEMLKDKIFSSIWEKSQSGPKKRVYKLDIIGTKKREEILFEAIGVVHKFYAEYLQSLPDEINIFDMMVNFLLSRMPETKKIGLVTRNKSKIVETLIKKIKLKSSSSNIYVIKPNLVKFDINFDNLFFVEGDFSSISLKDNYLDLLVIIGIPKKDSFTKSLNEWIRLLNQTGNLALIAPKVLIKNYRDPKTIGEFFEEFEHYESHKLEKIGSETIKRELKELFTQVEKKEIVHVTVFKASHRQI